MKRFATKVVALLLVFSMVFGMTGCKSSDYKKAVGLYEDGKYEQAEKMFAELGDYKDSALMATKSSYAYAEELMDDGEYEEAAEIFTELDDYEDSQELYRECRYEVGLASIKSGNYDAATAAFKDADGFKDANTYLDNMNVYKLHGFLLEKGPRTYTSKDPAYDVIMSAKDGGVIVLEYHFHSKGSGFELAHDFVAEITIGSSDAYLVGEGYMYLQGGLLDDKGTGTWDISTYTQGGTLKWETYEITGNKVNGAPLDAGAVGLAISNGKVPTAPLERMTAGAAQILYLILADNGPGVTMAELGFAKMG